MATILSPSGAEVHVSGIKSPGRRKIAAMCYGRFIWLSKITYCRAKHGPIGTVLVKRHLQ